MVEPFPVHTDDRTLRYKCVRVYILDQAEDSGRFALFGQNEHHLNPQAGVQSGSVDHRHSTMQVFIDTASNLFILLGNDEELYRLTCTVHHLVEHKAGNIKGGRNHKQPSPNRAVQSNWKK